MLGDSGEDVDRQPVRLREVGRHELNARLHQPRDESDVSGEPIQLCDQQGRAMRAAKSKGALELGPVTAAPALDLEDLGDDTAATSEVALDRRALSFQAETRPPLSIRGDAKIGDPSLGPPAHPFRPVHPSLHRMIQSPLVTIGLTADVHHST
jgi:hypothetical protein